jgi:MFS family permease
MAQGMASSSSTITAEHGVGAKIGGASMVVVLVSTAHAMSHAYGALLPLIVPFFLSDLHLTYTQVGLIFTISNLVWGPLQLGFGVLGRYRSRKWILGIGHICQGLCMVGTGLASSFMDLLAWRLGSRVADAPQHPIGNSLIAQSFGPERRGLGLAVNAAGSNLGTVVVPLIGGFLIAAVGWQSTLFLVGIPGIIIGALIIACLHEHREQTSRGQGLSGVGTELWSLLKQRNALLLLLAHVIGAGGRGLGVATLYVPLYLSQALNVSPARHVDDHHDDRQCGGSLDCRPPVRPYREKTGAAG